MEANIEFQQLLAEIRSRAEIVQTNLEDLRSILETAMEQSRQWQDKDFFDGFHGRYLKDRNRVAAMRKNELSNLFISLKAILHKAKRPLTLKELHQSLVREFDTLIPPQIINGESYLKRKLDIAEECKIIVSVFDRNAHHGTHYALWEWFGTDGHLLANFRLTY